MTAAMEQKEREPTPEELAAYLDFIARKQKLDQESEVVTPTPSFVVKTALVTVPPPSERPMAALPPGAVPGQKVFMNITCHAFLPPITARPGGDGSGGEGGGGGGPALSVPLAMGEPRKDRDKAGATAVAVDVIVHPSVTADAERDKSGHFRHWLVEFCLQYFARKFGAALSPQYKVPLLKYKGAKEGEGGGVHSQRLRKPKATVIGEGQAQAAQSSTAAAPTTLPQPMALLAEAGGLPEAATGLVVASGRGGAGGGGAGTPAATQLPRGPPRTAGSSTTTSSPMEIRLVGEERAREAKSFATRVAEEVSGAGEGEGGGGKSAEEAPGAPSLIKKAFGSGGEALSSSSSSSPQAAAAAAPLGTGIGLSQGSTRRLPKARTLQARVEAEVVGHSGGAPGADAGAGAPASGSGAAAGTTGAFRVECPVELQQGGGGGGGGGGGATAAAATAAALPPLQLFSASLPPALPPTAVAALRIELALSPPPPPLSTLSLRCAAEGTSITLAVAAPSPPHAHSSTAQHPAEPLRACLALPVPCSAVGRGGAGVACALHGA